MEFGALGPFPQRFPTRCRSLPGRLGAVPSSRRPSPDVGIPDRWIPVQAPGMRRAFLAQILTCLVTSIACLGDPDAITLVTYNLQNYLLEPLPSRAAKPVERRDRVVQMLTPLQPDILVVEEIGGAGAVEDLGSRLATAGIPLAHREIVWGADPAIAVAVLSRFPFLSRRSHSNDTILAEGRLLRTSRGFVEVEIEGPAGFRFTLLAAHLKSKRETGVPSEASLREAEARALRRHVDALLDQDPGARIVVAGDLNDHPDSRPLRLLKSRGPRALFDLRPHERPLEPLANAIVADDGATWTHHYAKEDSYGRFDYFLVSSALRSYWQPEASFVPNFRGWSFASDHRPVVARFGMTRRPTGTEKPRATAPRGPTGPRRQGS
jgi:endonuclease/exonuclease/phosphatase family metal-dependent hydrolase